MKIPDNLKNLTDQFKIMPRTINGLGETLFLVNPVTSWADWDNNNLIYRSSVWNSDGRLVSAGFKKFFNWGEKPGLSPTPEMKRINTFVEKLDGSLLIVSKYKGHYILRTRGTIDATVLENGYELNHFKESILPKLNYYNCDQDTWDSSFLFEWLSYKNQIVINYGNDPKFKLIGEICHDSYMLTRQSVLNCMATELKLDRPKTYNFTNIADMLQDVNKWVGLEGVVVYSNLDQTLHKVKSDWYLNLHRLKSNLSSTIKVFEVWYSLNMPSYQDFYNYIETTFDHEIADSISDDIAKIIRIKEFYDTSMVDIKNFISNFPSNYTQKEKAADIIKRYKACGTDSLAFSILNNKLKDDTCYKFIYDRC